MEFRPIEGCNDKRGGGAGGGERGGKGRGRICAKSTIDTVIYLRLVNCYRFVCIVLLESPLSYGCL